jgi:DNA-binding NarL/FixJ family response regulator
LRAVRVLVVDDHPLVRHGLTALIGAEQGFEVCAQADAEESALDAIKESRPDMVVIGLSDLKSTTLELVRRVRMVAPEIRIMVCSQHEDSQHAARALKAGAMAFVCQSEAVENTLKALHNVRRGKFYVSNEITDQLLHRVADGSENDQDAPPELLSDRELQVFERYGRGMTTQDIAKQLHLSPKTVDTHRQRIKQKLGLRSTNEVVWAAAQFLLQDQ